MGYLTSLRTLNMRGNRLKTVPGELAALDRLLTLNASVNHIEHLPETLRYGCCATTQRLDSKRWNPGSFLRKSFHMLLQPLTQADAAHVRCWCAWPRACAGS